MNVELQDAFGQFFTWKYAFVATVVLLVYEYVITIDEEVEYIWSRPRSTFTFLWVLLRYPFIISFLMIFAGFFPHGWSQKFSLAWTAIASILTFVSLLTGHAIFFLRAYALYSRATYVLLLCLPFLIAEVGSAVYGIYMFVSNGSDYLAMSWDPSPHHGASSFGPSRPVRGMGNLQAPHTPACSTANATACLGLLAWTLPFVFDVIITVLTLLRSFRVYRQSKLTPLLTVLLRDGVIYFAISGAVYAATLIALLVSPVTESFYGEFCSLPIAILGIMAVRLSLNLREVQPERLPSSTLARPSFGVLTGLDEVIDELAGMDADDLDSRDEGFTRQPRRSFAWTPLQTFRMP